MRRRPRPGGGRRGGSPEATAGRPRATASRPQTRPGGRAGTRLRPTQRAHRADRRAHRADRRGYLAHEAYRGRRADRGRQAHWRHQAGGADPGHEGASPAAASQTAVSQTAVSPAAPARVSRAAVSRPATAPAPAAGLRERKGPVAAAAAGAGAADGDPGPDGGKAGDRMPERTDRPMIHVHQGQDRHDRTRRYTSGSMIVTPRSSQYGLRAATRVPPASTRRRTTSSSTWPPT